MNRPIKTTLLFAFLLFSGVYACSQEQLIQEKKLYIQAGPLVSSENFRWSIAGNEQGTNPNILSELRFTSLKMAGEFLDLTYRVMPRLYLRGTISQQYGLHGSVSDIDYVEDNRGRPSGIQKFQSRNNKAGDYSASLSYQLLNTRYYSFSAGAGYYFSRTKYTMHEAIKNHTKALYLAQWQGPHIRMDGRVKLRQKWHALMSINGRYHIYNARANWMVRTDFSHPLSFVQDARGLGIGGQLGVNYQLSARFGLQLSGCLQGWKTGAGTDLLYMTDGETVTTKMNESIKMQTGTTLGGVFHF